MRKTIPSDRAVFLVFLLTPLLMFFVGQLCRSVPGLWVFVPGLKRSLLSIIPLCPAMLFLGVGFLCKDKPGAGRARMLGFFLFAFYLALPWNLTYPSAKFVLGRTPLVYIALYFAYREWWSQSRNETPPSCLRVLAGATLLIVSLHYGMKLAELWVPVKTSLKQFVAMEIQALLGLFNIHAVRQGFSLFLEGGKRVNIASGCIHMHRIYFFVGLTLAMDRSSPGRRVAALFVSIAAVHGLNLLRILAVVFAFLWGWDPDVFERIANAVYFLSFLGIFGLLAWMLPAFSSFVRSLVNLPRSQGPVEDTFRKTGKRIFALWRAPC